jgi:histone-lysine N-methyltransferase SETMAR
MICSELLERYENEGDNFLARTVTGDEIWLHHYEPETKRQSKEWHNENSPRKKKFRAAPSAGKVMATVFWDMEGLLLVDIMPKGTTINSEAYVATLTNLHARLRRVRPHKQMADILLQHDNARPRVSLRTTEAINKFGWKVLPHPPYSPDLAPSNYHLFGKLKDSLRGSKFEDDESLVAAAKNFPRNADHEFYKAGIQALVKRWKNAVESGRTYESKPFP